MAYAKTLPPPVINICRWFNAICLLITTTICLDVFLIPRVTDKEKIIAIEEFHVTFRNAFRARTTTQLENVILVTESMRVPFRATAYFYLEQADSVQVVRTRLLNIIEEGTVSVPELGKELKQETGMFGKLMFIPIAFALISLTGVLMWNNKEQLLNATIMNVIMLLILLVTSSLF